MSKPDLSVGEVTVDLAGEVLVLRPTLRAAQAINRQFGTLGDALRQVASLNVEAYISIIRHGANVRDAEQRDLGDKVFRAGIARLSGPVAEYLTLLLNGGRPQRDADLAEAPAEGNA